MLFEDISGVGVWSVGLRRFDFERQNARAFVSDSATLAIFRIAAMCDDIRS